ncbi:MAG: GNAT family N-acetyltransferase [Dehalococcoidales bacterium]|nr:GNAT family N-acetyltransferase [Dehalococcoidales bacterium]
MKNILIRPFKLADYNGILALWDGADLPYRPAGRDSYDNIKKQLDNGTTVFLVAEADGKPVGCVLGTHDGRKGWINRLAVDAEYRNQGIARKLVGEMEGQFASLGLEVIACVIDGDNEISQEVFQKLGYEYYDVHYYSRRKTPES